MKLVNNIVANPMEPKYRKIRANNPGFSKKVLRCPGGQDLLLGLGFRTKVMEFEEMWIVDEDPVLHRALAEGAVVLEHHVAGALEVRAGLQACSPIVGHSSAAALLARMHGAGRLRSSLVSRRNTRPHCHEQSCARTRSAMSLAGSQWRS